MARIPMLCDEDEEMILVKLHRVERAGIWIESQKYTESMLKRFGFSSSQTTLVLFVPFARVDFIVGSIGLLALSEEAFGLRQ